MPKISVIIPVYNKAKYLTTILTEVKNQRFTDFECIIIDDGSTDDSSLISDKFAKSDTRFKVIHIVNSGVSHARNVGIKSAKGEYITFIDADDQIHMNYLKNLFDCISCNNVDIVISSYKKFWDNDKKTEIIKYPLSGLKYVDQILQDFAYIQKKTGIFGCCVAKIFSSKLVSDIEFDESIKLAEDFDFYLKIYDSIQTIYFDEHPYYYYRQEAINSTSLICDSDIDYFSQLKINLRYRNFLQNKGAYKEENRKIVDDNLSNYLYLTINYSPMKSFNKVFNDLICIQKNENISLENARGFKNIILFLLGHRLLFLTKIIICTKRVLHNFKKGVKL